MCKEINNQVKTMIATLFNCYIFKANKLLSVNIAIKNTDFPLRIRVETLMNITKREKPDGFITR